MIAPEERPLVFMCHEQPLVAIAHVPSEPASLGVIIVVGGPQYRVGSHRQFTSLGRTISKRGFATLRFDYRGMGDSLGDARNFEDIDDDIRCAIDALSAAVPHVKQVVLWGLCDGASAALMYAASDPRVAGIVAANPWARTDQGEAKVQVTHYYAQRILDLAFWRKLLSGSVNLRASVREFAHKLARSTGIGSSAASRPARHFLDRMQEGVARFEGRVGLILSSEDLTAKEFESVCLASPVWKRALERIGCDEHRVMGADHTFSTAAWQREVEQATIDWLVSWCASLVTRAVDQTAARRVAVT